MLLRAHTRCVVTPMAGHDILGKELLGKCYAAKCGVVKIEARSQTTTVRADSSASRGYAEEKVIAARLLFPTVYPVKVGDKIDVHGLSVRVVEVMPRINLVGRLDHNQVDGVMWA